MKEVGYCEVCRSKFSLISWRRFCAKCKRTCCKECLSGRIKGSGNNSANLDRLKICSDCVVAESTTQSISIHEDLEITGQINRDLRLELKEKILALEKFRTFLLQISTTFGPNSDLFPDSHHTPNGTDDHNYDITELVNKCQDDFENMQDKIRMMRRRYENSISNEETNRTEIERLNRKIEQISGERDSLRSALSQMDYLKCDMEDQKQQYQDVLLECEKLKTRCKKLELLLRTPSSSTRDISSVLEDHNPPPRRAVSRLRFWLSSTCCPRFFRNT